MKMTEPADTVNMRALRAGATAAHSVRIPPPRHKDAESRRTYSPCLRRRGAGMLLAPARRMQRLLAACALLLSLGHPASAGAGHVTRCYADCPVELTGCRDTFIRGHYYRDCVRRIVYACHHAGGCGAVMPTPPTDRCRDNVFCPMGRPICDAGRLRCERQPGAPSLPAGNYNVSFCASGEVTIPCQGVGMFPIANFNLFEQAIQSAMSQFLAANGAGGCSLGAGQAAAAGGGVNVTFSATCTDPVSGATVSESVVLQVRP